MSLVEYEHYANLKKFIGKSLSEFRKCYTIGSMFEPIMSFNGKDWEIADFFEDGVNTEDGILASYFGDCGLCIWWGSDKCVKNEKTNTWYYTPQ